MSNYIRRENRKAYEALKNICTLKEGWYNKYTDSCYNTITFNPKFNRMYCDDMVSCISIPIYFIPDWDKEKYGNFHKFLVDNDLLYKRESVQC